MRSRVVQPELMDDPALDRREHVRALRGLARINRLSGAASRMWREIRPHVVERLASGAEARILDIATGSGDVPLAVTSLAAREGIALRVSLCDVSQTALHEAAEAAHRRGLGPVETRTADAVGSGLPFHDNTFAVVTCSLFLHHLTEAECIRMLREMARITAPGGLVVVSDLRRCRSGLVAAWLAGRLLTRSRVVRVDAVRSVRAAYTTHEMQSMACDAGLDAAGAFCVLRSWPWRLTLRWSKR
jgi:ubiquinone/menaquinone biosynthesis C-methylase UbiE